MDLQRPALPALAQIEQGQVPPKMGDHERVQIAPAVMHILQKAGALVDAPLGQHHMGQGVLGPGLLALQPQRLAGGGLGLVQQMALLKGEGGHAVGVGDLPIGLQHGQGRAQHLGEPAQVEVQILADLDHDQIARKGCDGLVAQGQGGRHVILAPGVQHLHGQLFAPGGAVPRRLGQGQVFGRPRRGLRRLQQHPQNAGIGVGQGAGGIALGRAKNVGGAGLIGQEAFDEVVDRRQGGVILGGDGIAQPIRAHDPGPFDVARY